MKVSIIIPVYNVSDYVERCLNSVMVQTYTDLECIIVDDCTPDDSIAKCKRMISEYNGSIEFKILHHEHNRGLSAARNTGTNAATGAYIYFLDSDDEITPNCISLLIKETELHPQIDMTIAGDQQLSIDGSLCKTHKEQAAFFSNNIHIRHLFFELNSNFPICAWNKLIRRDFIFQNNLFFKEGAIFEDQIWLFLAVQRCTSLSIIPNITYNYYINPNSIMGNTTFLRGAEAWFIILEELLPQITPPLSKLQIYYLLRHFFEWYTGGNRPRYRKIVNLFVQQLLTAHKYLLSAQVYIFFNLRLTSLKNHIKTRFLNHIMNKYWIESTKTRKCIALA